MTEKSPANLPGLGLYELTIGKAKENLRPGGHLPLMDQDRLSRPLRTPWEILISSTALEAPGVANYTLEVGPIHPSHIVGFS